MESRILNIKNMVCDRCIRVVREELEKLGYQIDSIKLGEVKITARGNDINLNEIRNILDLNGFELIDDKQARMIENIKIALIDLIHNHPENLEKISLSGYLSEKFHTTYQHISSIFSAKEGITIEKYFINQKIEKVKEFIVYDELTLSEISYKLGYSSVQHLSNQFKKITGFTPSEFRRLRDKKRLPIDKVK